MLNDDQRILGELKAFAEAGASKELLVGFFKEATYPDGTQVAKVAEIQEFGDGQRIPARPFFRPTITEYENEWSQLIEKHLAAGDDIETILTIVGGEAVGRIQEKISQIFEPPLAPYTIQKRLERGNKSTKPLIDTGRMRQAVAFHIKDIE